MLSSSLVQQLQADLKGAIVLTPASQGYEESLKRWSETAEKRAGAVALVTTPEQVATAIRFARTHRIEQVIRGGGHGTNGASSSEGGIVIDLSKMNRVTVDPENMTITAEGGCLWKDVDNTAGDYGLAAVGGTVNHTGIGGLTLGGGYGYLTGRHGLVIDNLLKVKLVNADSEIVTASAEQHPDLFWAIRGAGASFGAVVEFTYRAHQQREPVWAGMAAFSLDKLAPIVKFANDFAHSQNPDASFNFGFTTPPHAPGPMLVTLSFYNGLGKDGKRIFAPLFEAGPAFQNFGPMPYCKVNGLLEESAGHGGRKVIGGAACAVPFALEFYEEIKQDLLSFIKEVPAAKESLLVFELVHPGKLQEVDVSATAFADGRSDNMFGSHDEKLVALKLKYDPTNVFNKWGAVTAAAVEQNHGYNTMNLKPKQIAVE
ncbi:MAG: hypothetical protein Q9226_002147 [Calogaya cf. arnoldii]